MYYLPPLRHGFDWHRLTVIGQFWHCGPLYGLRQLQIYELPTCWHVPIKAEHNQRTVNNWKIIWIQIKYNNHRIIYRRWDTDLIGTGWPWLDSFGTVDHCTDWGSCKYTSCRLAGMYLKIRCVCMLSKCIYWSWQQKINNVNSNRHSGKGLTSTGWPWLGTLDTEDRCTDRHSCIRSLCQLVDTYLYRKQRAKSKYMYNFVSKSCNLNLYCIPPFRHGLDEHGLTTGHIWQLGPLYGYRQLHI